MRHVTDDERRARLGERHFLAVPADGVETASERLVGFHASDPTSVYLSARARVADFEAHSLEGALYDSRALVRMLGMRRTMFVVPRHVAAVMNAACTRDLAVPERNRLLRLLDEQLELDDPASWLEDVEIAVIRALERDGPSTAAELTQAVPELGLKLSFGAGKKWQGEMGISTRILFLLATDAVIVRGRPRGTWRSSLYEWALTRDWLGAPLAEPDPEPAQDELVGRWLRTYGPGSLVDIQWWTGWTKSRTRAVLERIEAQEVALDGGIGYLATDDSGLAEDAHHDWVALLPGLDPAVMGWKEREWSIGPHAEKLFDRNGNVGPTVWADGHVVGGWAQREDGTIAVRLLESVSKPASAAIDIEALRLAAWLGEHRVKPRFRTPIERDLAADR